MFDYFANLNPIILALIASLFAYLMTVLGSAVVFLFKKINKNVLDSSLSISSGLMISAAFFSLLNPAIDEAVKLNQPVSLVVTLGLLLGALLLFFTDKISAKILASSDQMESKKRIFMLLFSITMHNIPEGLVVGLAFGALHFGNVTLTSACMLTLGIAIQNFPEGSALSLPLFREGLSKKKAFFLGQISGIVEPIAGMLGAFLSYKIESVLPIMLSFAAGCMLYVVIEELIPESQTNKRKDLMALFSVLGFMLMMFLEIILG